MSALTPSISSTSNDEPPLVVLPFVPEQPMSSYVYVDVVRGRDLPIVDVTAGTVAPFVEVKASNLKGVTKHREKNPNPEWRQTFAFPREHLLRHQVAPQWYRLAHRNGDKLHHGEIMLAVWTGIQAEDACCRHSDAHHSVPTGGLANRRSKD
ncbi:hypothetical protein C2845_PM18G08260 [Panicum miliaceum]|uniref:C2 domain-containing protein n=1 Tax=Panicum miliaceum TaxID=4540 RepID=A0A3L6PKC2_PANMI|nr:hypothetical protein C2845_PM18G08260 [Panicum miliaceum]